MYPKLHSDYSIRGTLEDPYVASSIQNKCFHLDSMVIVDVLRVCDGAISTRVLSERFCIDEVVLLDFLSRFEKEGVIVFCETPKQSFIKVSLACSEPWLKEVHIDITSRCNLASACKHCFRLEKLNSMSDKSFSDWLNVIEQMDEMGVHLVALSGGEPFLRQDLADMAEEFVKRKMCLNAIFTNGTIWSESVARTLEIISANGLHTTFYISLDGHIARVHDANRGKRSFDKTICFVKKLLEFRKKSGAKFRVAINSQVNVYNFEYLIAWYDILEKLGVDRWRITSGRVVGALAENIYLLPPLDALFIQYRGLVGYYIAKVNCGSVRTELNIESFFTSQILRSRHALTFDGDTAICDYKQNACSIEPDGEVQFCTSWTGRSFGNVFNLGLQKIWCSEEIQRMKTMKVGEIHKCANCELLELCGGGCRLTARTVEDKDEMACVRYGMFKKYIHPIMLENGVEFRSF